MALPRASTSLYWTVLVIFAAIPIIKGGGGGDMGVSMSDGTVVVGEASPEHHLFAKMFKTYNKHIRPIAYHGEITNVFFELSLFDILKVDTKNQMIRTNTEIIMKWEDHYLTWNPSDYNGTIYIRVPYLDIWYPDVILQNGADADYNGAILNTNAIVKYNGEVELLSHGIFNSICIFDVQYYPFDQQTCELKFASWTYDKGQIILQQGPADLSKFTQNPEFFLEDFYAEYHFIHNPCCKSPMSSVSFFVQIQRRTVFSLFFFIMPGILINVCALMVFSLPSETGEKVGLGINSMLAMMVFLMAMTENLPPTQTLPLAGIYYGTCITFIALNITFSVSVLNLNIMGMRGYQVPELFKTITVIVAKIIAVRIPIIVRESWDLNDEKEKDNDSLSDITSLTKVVPMNDATDIDGSLVKVFTVEPLKDIPPLTQTPPPTPPLEGDGPEQELYDDYDYDTLKDPFQKRSLMALESMNKILTREEISSDKTQKKSNLIEEWKFISRVMDRSLFIIFTMAAAFFNIAILTSSPFGERFSYCPIGEGLCDEMTFEEITALTSHAAVNSHVAGGGGGGGGGHGGGHGDAGGGGGGHGGGGHGGGGGH